MKRSSRTLGTQLVGTPRFAFGRDTLARRMAMPTPGRSASCREVFHALLIAGNKVPPRRGPEASRISASTGGFGGAVGAALNQRARRLQITPGPGAVW